MEIVHGQVRIWCSGGDLLDGTPVLDIKPYIPFVEAKPDAQAGFVQGTPELLKVVWQAAAQQCGLDAETQSLIGSSIAQDPRPAYQNLPERVYGMEIAGWNVHFRIVDKTAYIEDCSP